jgi:hypothetical protein
VIPCSQETNGLKKLSAAAFFKRLEGRRTALMTNRSYAINMSLLRIGVLAAQIAMSPSAAAQWRDFLVGEGDRLVDLARNLPYLGNDDDIVWASRKNGRGVRRKQTDSLPRAVTSSCVVLEGSK